MPIDTAASERAGQAAKIEFLDISFDDIAFEEVLSLLAQDDGRRFRYVVTPNVDHVVRLSRETDHEVHAAYRAASMLLCDSRILARLADLRGVRLQICPGSDLTAALLKRVIRAGDRVAIVGGSSSTLAILESRYPGVRFIQHIPPMGLRRNAVAMAAAAEFVVRSNARFAFLAVGSPQQELLAHHIASLPGASGVALCIGASIDFITGEAARAPRLIQRLHLEWAHRLASDPKRMWRRYLLEGPSIFWLAAKWKPAPKRVQ